MLSPKMDPRKPPEYILEVFADPTSVKDIVKGAYIPRLNTTAPAPAPAHIISSSPSSSYISIPQKPPQSNNKPTSQTSQTTTGILHTIFFHRYFPCIRPTSFDVLNLTLPAISDVELETLIDAR
ncbi:hypothetical protein EMPG_17858, partial [Blastomyces silverae]